MKTASVALILLALVVSGFAASTRLDTGAEPGELNTPNVTYTNVYGSPSFETGYIYDVGYAWTGGTGTLAPFAVKCDVEMWLNQGLNAANVYFHKADTTTAMSATVSGWLESNNGQWLFVKVPDCAPTGTPPHTEQEILSNLYFTKDGLGRTTITSGIATPIPVTWELRDDAATGTWGSFTPGIFSTGGNNGQLHGMTWLLAGGGLGHINYEIKVSIAPAAYQADGEWRMDPVIACAPEL